jgi:methionine synthase I (cobalamin-dependent)
VQELLQYIKESDRPLIADGAMGTMLIKYGLQTGQCPEEINISNPGMLERIHREYRKAGAIILQTNTFGANRIKLESYGLADKVGKVVGEGVKIAKEVAGDDAFVGLSVGPTGKLMKPYGTLSFNDLYEVFIEQIAAGVQAGADCICIETMGDMGELKAAYLAAREFNLPISCAVSFESGGRTLMGTGPDVYARTVSNWGSDIIGTNCISPESLLKIFEKIINNCTGPVYIRPNAGEPILKGNETLYPMTAEDFASFGSKFTEKGAKILGGCCGTMPEHVSLLEKTLENEKIKSIGKDNRKWLTSAVDSVEITNNLKSSLVNIRNYVNKDFIETQKVANALGEIQISDSGIIVMDFSEISCNNVAETIEFVQATVRTPLAFKVNSVEILKRALRPYKGIAGVIAPDLNQSDVSEVLEAYGGEIIDNLQ